MSKRVVAVVGAGREGMAILATLLDMPGTTVASIFDPDPLAPARELAKAKGIPCATSIGELCKIPGIDLIFDVSEAGKAYQEILKSKEERTRVLHSKDLAIIQHLIDENQKLQKINSEKTKYLRHATHQLKAPFAAIQSYSEVMLGGYAGEIPEKIRDLVEKIKYRCMTNLKALKDMLLLTDLRALSRQDLPKKPCSLSEIIPDVVCSLEELARSRKIEIIHGVGENLIVMANRDQLVLLLGNLIENAICYSFVGDSIHLFTDVLEGGRVKLLIVDRGIGIEENSLDKIYNEYFRAGEAQKMNDKGNGLGLSIVRELVSLHDFKLEIESKIGVGTTVTVEMPLVVPS